MSLAFERSDCVDRAVTVLRAGVLARGVCGRAEVAAVFERSFYLRAGDDFVCIGEPAIGNGPTRLIIAARVGELGLRQGQRAFISNRGITIGDLSFDFRNCATWRAPPWPTAYATLAATCAEIAQRPAVESPTDSLARAAFGADDTPLARLACPRVAAFASWLGTIVGGHGAARLSPPYGVMRDLVGLGYGLTPSGDDFLVGAMAALDALGQTNMHATLSRAVMAGVDRTSPLSASFLRAAAAGHVGENLHAMVAAILTGDANSAVAQAQRIGHTSGWDALAGAVMTLYRC